jgi:glycolate oxidase
MGSAHAVGSEVAGVEAMTAVGSLVEALSRGLPGDRLVVDPDVLAAISHDEAEWALAGTAAAGVRARTEAEVQHVVRTCAEFGAPIVPRDYVLGLRAVVGGPVAYGDAVRLGRRTTKGVAGLDMVGLFVGSEGTLGVVTEVTLRLRPALTGTPRTIVGAFPDLVSCGQAVAQITRRGLTPAVLELLDRACLEAVEEWKHLGIDADAAALLLARVDTPGDSGAAESAAIAATMTETGALWAEQSTDDAEAEALFDARRLAYPAFERLGPVLTEDICVPRSKVPAMLEQMSAIAVRHGVRIATVAHAGDGNLHPLIITPPGDSAARMAAQAAFEQFLDAAIALGGTVTGEHGVGILKRDGMRRELDPGSLALQAAVRHALDPREVFNPGKG